MADPDQARTYTDADKARILDAYARWNPEDESQESLVRRLGTTKTTMMKIVAEAGVDRKRPVRKHTTSWTT